MICSSLFQHALRSKRSHPSLGVAAFFSLIFFEAFFFYVFFVPVFAHAYNDLYIGTVAILAQGKPSG